jgi:hypothetical protein
MQSMLMRFGTGCGPVLSLVLLLLPGATKGRSQSQVTASTPATNAAPYPHVNLSPSYAVDPSWPQRPPEIPWGHVPSIALDAEENVWIYTRTNPIVQVYAPDGRYLFGWRTEHTNSAAHAIKFDKQGNVWLVDVGRHVVRKLTRQGQELMVLGTPGVPGTDATHFNKPTDITFAANGDLFIADGYGNSRIVHFDNKGSYQKAWGSLGTKPGQFSIPHAIAIDSKGRLYVADRNNVRIQVFNTRGKLLDVWQNIMVPWNFWMSPKDEIWVCGSSPMIWGFDPKYPTAPLGCPPKDQMLVQFNTAGKVLQLWTLPKGEDGCEKPGEVNWLHAIALDRKGNLYLGDIIGRRIQKFVRRD